MGPVTDGLSVGLDIGATKTLGLVADADGTIRAEVREPTEPGAEGRGPTAARVVEALRKATDEELTGAVGIGVPGLVDVEQGAVKHAVNLDVDGDWFPLRTLLADRLGVPVVVENDVNAAALGAVALSGKEDLVYLSIGTGLAAGLVLGGRLRRGNHGAAGEIGHLPVDPAGAPCQCGQRGCLETVASGSALAAAWPSGRRTARAGRCSRPLPPVTRRRSRCATGSRPVWPTPCARSAWPSTRRPWSSVAAWRTWANRCGSRSRPHCWTRRRRRRSWPRSTSPDRLRVVPTDYPVAAVGAALLGRTARPA